MSMPQNKIYFGFFPDFEKPTLLFFGNSLAFSAFKDWLLSYSKVGEISVSLGDVPVFVAGNVDVVVKVIPKSTGMKKIDDHIFEWGISLKTCQKFAGLLEPLTESNVPVHQYLECGALDDVVVLASVDEYSVDFFQSRGEDMWNIKASRQ